MTISPVHVAFRVDAGTEIGTGHVMRCLTLANAIKNRGGQCVFVCRPHAGNLIESIKKQGFAAIALPCLPVSADIVEADTSPHAAWLCTDQDSDARDTSAVLDKYFSGNLVDWLVVDHYALDERWESSLRPRSKQVLVIDDLADRPHDCDLLLDQSLGRDEAHYAALVPQTAKLLIGPQYALLRPEFARLRAASFLRRDNPQLRNLLVTMGGVDKDNATGVVLEALSSCTLPEGVKITVVMGAQAPWLELVLKKAATMPFATDVRVGVNNMAALMFESDLAIGGGGMTTWERCCLGLPCIIVELAANQSRVTREVVRAKAACLSDLSEMTTTLKNIIESADFISQLATMSNNAVCLTDGDGAIKVTNYILECAT